MKFAITIYAVAVLTMLGCTTLEVGRYEAALVGDTLRTCTVVSGYVPRNSTCCGTSIRLKRSPLKSQNGLTVRS